MMKYRMLSAGESPRIEGSYSAAIPAAPATLRNASSTRVSKPGLSGANVPSSSLLMPTASAARKMCLRRNRNFDAVTGSPKSATSTAHALSYAAHSGESVSGVSFGRGSLLGISLAFSCVGSSQRYNAQAIISQNINENVQAAIQKPARSESFFGVVQTVIKKNLRALPVETGRIGKMQATLRKVLRGLGLVPFKMLPYLICHCANSLAVDPKKQTEWHQARKLASNSNPFITTRHGKEAMEKCHA